MTFKQQYIENNDIEPTNEQSEQAEQMEKETKKTEKIEPLSEAFQVGEKVVNKLEGILRAQGKKLPFDLKEIVTVEQLYDVVAFEVIHNISEGILSPKEKEDISAQMREFKTMVDQSIATENEQGIIAVDLNITEQASSLTEEGEKVAETEDNVFQFKAEKISEEEKISRWEKTKRAIEVCYNTGKSVVNFVGDMIDRSIEVPQLLMDGLSDKISARGKEAAKLWEYIKGSLGISAGMLKMPFCYTYLTPAALTIASAETPAQWIASWLDKDVEVKSWNRNFRENFYGVIQSSQKIFIPEIELEDNEIRSVEAGAENLVDQYMAKFNVNIEDAYHDNLVDEYGRRKVDKMREDGSYKNGLDKYKANIRNEQYNVFYWKSYREYQDTKRLNSEGETFSYTFGIKYMQQRFEQANNYKKEEDFYEERGSKNISEAFRYLMHGKNQEGKVEQSETEQLRHVA